MAVTKTEQWNDEPIGGVPSPAGGKATRKYTLIILVICTAIAGCVVSQRRLRRPKRKIKDGGCTALKGFAITEWCDGPVSVRVTTLEEGLTLGHNCTIEAHPAEAVEAERIATTKKAGVHTVNWRVYEIGACPKRSTAGYVKCGVSSKVEFPGIYIPINSTHMWDRGIQSDFVKAGCSLVQKPTDYAMPCDSNLTRYDPCTGPPFNVSSHRPTAADDCGYLDAYNEVHGEGTPPEMLCHGRRLQANGQGCQTDTFADLNVEGVPVGENDYFTFATNFDSTVTSNFHVHVHNTKEVDITGMSSPPQACSNRHSQGSEWSRPDWCLGGGEVEDHIAGRLDAVYLNPPGPYSTMSGQTTRTYPIFHIGGQFKGLAFVYNVHRRPMDTSIYNECDYDFWPSPNGGTRYDLVGEEAIICTILASAAFWESNPSVQLDGLCGCDPDSHPYEEDRHGRARKACSYG